jgi:hypothetical protein
MFADDFAAVNVYGADANARAANDATANTNAGVDIVDDDDVADVVVVAAGCR